MSTEQGLLNQIILWLWKRHSRAVTNFSGKLADLHETIAKRYQNFDDRELENLLKAPRVNFLDHKKFLFLEPPEEGDCVLPILTLMYDFDRDRALPDFGIRLAIFLFGENDDPQAIGYRFESPEGGDRHNYYHAQPIRSFSIDEMEWPLPCPSWLPVKRPTFALDAQNFPSLFVSLLISLYGLKFIKEMRQANYWNLLKPHVEGKMICLNLPVRPGSKREQKGMDVSKRQRRK